MLGDDKTLHTCFMTFEADEESRDMFYIVMGSIAENFKGVSLVEFRDDTTFAEPPVNAMAALHGMVTAEERLTKEQRRQLKEFSKMLNEWTGEESE